MPSVIRKLFDLLGPRDRVQLYWLVVILLVVAVIEMAGIASIMPFMAVVTNSEVIHSNRWLNAAFEVLGFESDQAFLTFLGLFVLGVLVTTNLFKATSMWLTLRYHNKLNYVLARQLLAGYLAQPYAFFLNRNTAELGKNVLTEVRNVVVGIVSPATVVVSSSLVISAILTLLVVVDPFVTGAIVTVLGTVYGVVYLMARHRLTVIGRQQVEANAQKYKAAGEGLSGIKDLKILGRELSFLHRFSSYAKLHSRNNVKAGVIAELPRYALEIIAFGGILLVVLYLLGKERKAESMVPLLALYAFAGYRLMPSVQQLFAAFAQMRQSMPALELLHQDLACWLGEKSDPEAQLAASSHVTLLPFRQSLELRNISFRYEGAPQPALCSLNLVIKPNTSVALVGPTGCGKTTTVDLILGLLEPSQGQILVDRVEINRDNLARWLPNLGYVPQQIYISDNTIARNIAFGIPDDEIDMEAVRHAARIANLLAFVETELPRGFETEIGERGVRLSGGQRQRIGIARALYRDPAVLIMDEATSALDGITEEEVMEAIRNLSGQKTVIMIAHRLTTVKNCDEIYLLKHGRIVDQGTFDELQQSSEWFRAATKVRA